MTKVLVGGAGGFIGGHLVRRLKREGFWVRGVDLKYHEFSKSPADEFIIGDLRDPCVVAEVVRGIDLGLPACRGYPAPGPGSAALFRPPTVGSWSRPKRLAPSRLAWHDRAAQTRPLPLGRADLLRRHRLTTPRRLSRNGRYRPPPHL